MKFTKMQGAGNDYVYVDATKNEIDDPAGLAIKLSERHFGIGSDGVIYIRKSPEHKGLFMMDLYNADGSRAKMCGNGIRCVGKYLWDHKMVDKDEIEIDTLSGVKQLKLIIDEAGNCTAATVNMGVPILETEKIPADKTKFENSKIPGMTVDAEFAAAGEHFRATLVSMGNPHCVIFTDDTSVVTELGPHFEWNEAFPEGVNTEFVKIINDNTVEMRVWERGSGETYACGTGCSAVGTALVLNEKIKGNDVDVICLGGTIHIHWEGIGSPVFMTGPCENVFDGELFGI